MSDTTSYDALISIHALREESDPRLPRDRASERISIHALREESDQAHGTAASTASPFQSTLSVRRATRQGEGQSPRIQISIHALREESDSRLKGDGDELKAFQSTLSVRRATWLNFSPSPTVLFQSTLSVRRATGGLVRTAHRALISIHALREESDFPAKEHEY